MHEYWGNEWEALVDSGVGFLERAIMGGEKWILAWQNQILEILELPHVPPSLPPCLPPPLIRTDGILHEIAG